MYDFDACVEGCGRRAFCLMSEDDGREAAQDFLVSSCGLWGSSFFLTSLVPLFSYANV